MMLHGTVFPFPKTICLQGFILVLQAISFIDHLTRKEERRYLPANQMRKNGPIHLDKVLENAFLTGAGLPATINTV
mgnify:CR=1 FL=1